jgi:hypothetical protein
LYLLFSISCEKEVLLMPRPKSLQFFSRPHHLKSWSQSETAPERSLIDEPCESHQIAKAKRRKYELANL